MNALKIALIAATAVLISGQAFAEESKPLCFVQESDIGDGESLIVLKNGCFVVDVSHDLISAAANYKRKLPSYTAAEIQAMLE